MKLLLLDRPKNPKILSERNVEFFGPWVQPINTPEDLSKPAFEPYPDAESVYKASLKAMEAAENILDSLSLVLPGITGVKKGKRFWRACLGFQITMLSGIVEDIKIRQMALPEKNYILGLPASEYPQDQIPYSWRDAWSILSFNDYFKWYAMSLYLKDFYKEQELVEYTEIPMKRLCGQMQEIYTKFFQSGYKRILRKLNSLFFSRFKFLDKERRIGDIGQLYSLLWDRYQFEEINPKELYTAYLPERYLPGVESLPKFRADIEKRKFISNSLPHPYGKLVSMTLPLIYIEGLPELIGLIDKDKILPFKHIERVYTHGQAFAHDGLKKLLFAMLAEKGKKIISIQHGCGDIYWAHSGMMTERVIADEHIYWGNGYSNFRGIPRMNTVKTLPSIYLSNLQKKSAENKQTGKKRWNAVFVILEENRYLKWIYTPIFPDMAHDYFARQKSLFKYFSTQEKIAAKVYPVTYGWKQAEWIKSKYPSIEIMSTGKFVNYALKSKLVVIDYIGTSFLEILAMGIPFLATWNRRWFRGEKTFEGFIDKLKDAGIFHETPETLIKSYSRIIKDTRKWWQEKKRQKIIKEMTEEFAMTSDIAYEKWALEFRKNTSPRRPL